LLIETLELLERGACPRKPQPSEGVTLARILQKEDGRINWQQPAVEIFNRARGFLPWPGAWTTLRGQRFNIWKCRPVSLDVVGMPALAPGQLCALGKRLFAGTGSQQLELLEIQMEGRKRADAKDFLNGFRLAEGDSFQRE
jgi:methionyl-tRNA formyltransferase